MQGLQRVLKAASGEHSGGKAATHQYRNDSLQLLVVAGAGIFQGRVKLEVRNAKRQEEQGDPNRQLLRSLITGGGGRYYALVSAAGGCPGNVAGRNGGSIRAGN